MVHRRAAGSGLRPGSGQHGLIGSTITGEDRSRIEEPLWFASLIAGGDPKDMESDLSIPVTSRGGWTFIVGPFTATLRSHGDPKSKPRKGGTDETTVELTLTHTPTSVGQCPGLDRPVPSWG